MIIDARGRQVDHHHPGADVAAEMPGMLQGVRDDTGGETELPAIGDFQRLFVVADPDGARDRSEYLFTIDALIRSGIRDDSGRHVIAAVFELQLFAAGHDAAAFVSRNPDVAEVLLELELANSRADLC